METYDKYDVTIEGITRYVKTSIYKDGKREVVKRIGNLVEPCRN